MADLCPERMSWMNPPANSEPESQNSAFLPCKKDRNHLNRLRNQIVSKQIRGDTVTTMAGDSGRTRGKPSKEDVAQVGSLNFKVTPEFKKEFKAYAVNQGITMVDLLKEGFALSKQQREQ
ncbi:MAG: hypothetical protein ACPGU7_11025 [Gammaproteobacteria bacterium]